MDWKSKKEEKNEGKDSRGFAVDGIKRIIPAREKALPKEAPHEARPEAEPTTHPKKQEDAQQEEGKAPEEQAGHAAPSLVMPADDPDVAEIEGILSDGLEDMFYGLPENLQAEFRHEGEKAARSISDLLRHARLRAGKVLRVIREWLMMLPGMNRLFVEQQAKIKLDRILEWKDKGR